MSSDQEQRANEIFNACKQAGEPHDWAKLVTRECAGDPSLESAVLNLLEAHVAADSFLERPLDGLLADYGAEESAATMAMPTVTEKPGTRIGEYKLLQQIGEGGFGVVYMAEQKKPVRRKVALKIIKPGMDTKEVIARFEAERQALALMDHPNVAKVLDAGATESGRPYFVMELVHGVSITEFCADQKLSTRERLELFVNVCRAVQHAHQKGIIHRDLKPTNILITMDDDRPLPKVIDFGISKALSQQLTEKTLFTAYGQMVGTPMYMSPEQAQYSAHDIDTRSDVYSLGVLLYELLTDSTPFDNKTLQDSGLDEMRRMIREVDPPRPSNRVSTLSAERLSTVSTRRKTDPRQLGISLRRELDWIVMRAMEKDRNRRYESASAIAADILSYLNDEPVRACPPSFGYRFSKFARRKKAVLTTSALVAIAVIVGTGVSIWQAVRATNEAIRTTNEAQRATRAENLASFRLEQVNEQRLAAEENYTEAESQRRRAEDNVQLALDVLEEIYLPLAESETREKVELTEQDRQLLEKLLPFYEALAAQKINDPETLTAKAKAYLRVGNIYQNLRIHPNDKDEHSERSLRRAIELHEELARVAPDKWEHKRNLACSYRDLGQLLCVRQPEQSEQAYRRSIEVFNDVNDDLPWHLRNELSYAQNTLAERLRANWKRPEESQDLFRKNLRFSERLLAEFPDAHIHHAQVFDCLYGIGRTYQDLDQPQQAEAFFVKALDCYEQWASEFPKASNLQFHLGKVLTSLADLQQHSNRLESAEESYVRARDVLEIVVKNSPNNYWHASQLGNNTLPAFARFLESSQRFEEAEIVWRQAIEVNEKLATEFPNSGAPHLKSYRDTLTQLLLKMGRGDKVLVELERAVELEPNNPGCHLALCVFLNGKQHVEYLDYDRALFHAKEAVRLAPDEWSYYVALGDLYLRHGQPQQTLQALQDSNHAMDLADSAGAYLARGKLYARMKQYDQALADYSAAEKRTGDPLSIYRGFADLYIARGQWQLAVDYLNKDISLAPLSWWRYKRRARVNFYLERYGETLADVAQAVEFNAGDLSNLTWVSTTHIASCPDQNLREGLLDLADRTVELTDGAPVAYVTRGYLKARLGNLDEALADYERGIEATEDPGFRAQHYNNAAWYLATSPQTTQRHVEKAIEWVEKAIELEGSTDAPASLYQSSQPSNLMRFLPSADPFAARGSLYAVLKMYERARADFDQVISSDVVSYYSQYQHALVCLTMDDTEGYQNACRMMLEKFADTTNPSEARFTAWTCALAPNAVADYMLTVELAEQALSSDPKLPAHQQSLGAVMYRAGRFHDAIGHFNNAVESEKDERTSPVYGLYFLAMTHHQLGNADDARESLNRANQQANQELNDAAIPVSWNRRVTLELLRSDAETLIGVRKSPVNTDGGQPLSPPVSEPTDN